MKKYSMETIVGIFVLIGLLCVAYITVKLGNVSLFGGETYTLYARFTSVSGLKVNNPVEMLGMEVGSVSGFEMDQEKQLAIVELEIDEGIKVYGDAIASIETSGLIGDKYVSIDPGGAYEVLKPGDTITETEPPVNIGDLISDYAFGNVNEQ